MPRYHTKKGVLTDENAGEVYAPIAMWLEAIDLVLERLRSSAEGLFDLSHVAGISGAGMQHGIVCWRRDGDTAASALTGLDPGKGLKEQLYGFDAEDPHRGPVAFTNGFSPNWQDASTQRQCDIFDASLGGPGCLAEVTGSRAHHVRTICSMSRFG